MSHFSTYFLNGMSEGLYVVYSNGHADNPSNSFWVVAWPEGYWS